MGQRQAKLKRDRATRDRRQRQENGLRRSRSCEISWRLDHPRVDPEQAQFDNVFDLRAPNQSPRIISRLRNLKPYPTHQLVAVGSSEEPSWPVVVLIPSKVVLRQQDQQGMAPVEPSTLMPTPQSSFTGQRTMPPQHAGRGKPSTAPTARVRNLASNHNPHMELQGQPIIQNPRVPKRLPDETSSRLVKRQAGHRSSVPHKQSLKYTKPLPTLPHLMAGNCSLQDDQELDTVDNKITYSHHMPRKPDIEEKFGPMIRQPPSRETVKSVKKSSVQAQLAEAFCDKPLPSILSDSSSDAWQPVHINRGFQAPGEPPSFPAHEHDDQDDGARFIVPQAPSFGMQHLFLDPPSLCEDTSSLTSSLPQEWVWRSMSTTTLYERGSPRLEPTVPVNVSRARLEQLEKKNTSILPQHPAYEGNSQLSFDSEEASFVSQGLGPNSPTLTPLPCESL